MNSGLPKNFFKGDSMQYFKFMTYNQALTYDRLERIILVCAVAAIVAAVEMASLPVAAQNMMQPYPQDAPWPLISMITAFAAQIYSLKCWVDMIILGRPHENCWSFGR